MRKNVITALALTNPVAVVAVALAAVVVVALLAAFALLLAVCVYFTVGYVVGRVLLALADIISKRPPTISAVIDPPIGEPTPRFRLGLDEHNRVEVIDVSQAGLEDPPSAVPAQSPRALLAPSTNRTTAATSKRRPQAAAQMEAAKHLLAGGQSLRAVARRLGVSESTLRGWRKKFSAEAAV